MAFAYLNKQHSFHLKASILLITFLLITVTTIAQTPRPVPAVYPQDAKINFIRTWNATAPETIPNSLMARSLQDVKQTTQYFDGLGRPLQTVIKQGSMATGSPATDLVSAIEYDQFGRQVHNYLPFASNGTGGNTHINDGAFKYNPFQQQATFMQQQYVAQHEVFYYDQVIFEQSPLNRTNKVLAAGNNWVGANRGTTTHYWLNTVTDSVRIWTVTNVTNSWATYSTASYYSPGTLFKTVVENEHGNQIIEFKDGENKVILKKVQLTASSDGGMGKGYAGWLCTYYIYDALNNLRCAVQPKGVELLLQNSWNFGALNGDILNEQCFRYEFDQRNRVIKQKLPGAGEVRIVYDQWDRVVLSQDANLRTQNKWLFTKYDALNRPIMTGTYVNTTDTTQYGMQTYVNTQAMARYENYTPASALPMYSLNQSFPAVTYSNVLTVTYFDDYAWTSGVPTEFRTFESGYNSYFYSPSNINYPYAQPLQPGATIMGLISGGIVKSLDGTTDMVTTQFYDEKGRVIQAKTGNYKGGCDILTIQYTFSNQVLKSMLRHQKPSPQDVTSYVFTDYDYDDLGRLLKIRKNISAGIAGAPTIATGEVTTVEHEYDAMGQLKKKNLGKARDGSGNYTTSPLDSFKYDFNIRGWMLGMNRQYVKDTNSISNFFGFDLGYDKDTIIINATNKFYASKQYNGNIGGMLWKSTGDDRVRKYDFTYDAVNQSKAANFTQLTNNSFNLSAGIDFSVSGLSYDANGNILTMNQKGWKPGNSATIDSLLYTYIPNTNRLQNILDRKNDTATRLGDFRSSGAYMTALSQNKTTGSIDYAYDANGNLVKDLNKDIKQGSGNGITYNLLNLPETIRINGKGTITYTYDATGNKMKKTVVDSTVSPAKTTVTLYLSGFEYLNDTLQHLGHEEGRIRYKKTNSSLILDYYVKDHLGNVRMVLTDEQQMDTYPEVTFEDANVGNEQVYYDSVNQERVARPGSFFTSTSNGNKVQLLRKSTQSIGTGKLLKVMATDRLHIKVDYYTPNDATDNSNANGINSVIGTLISMLNATTAPASLKGSGITITNELNNSSIFTTFLASQGSSSASSMPKAYLNILFFDEQFRFVPESSEIVQITTKDSARQIFRISANAKVADKNGYAYVYVSNESNNLVYFDNFQVSHERGTILEETHYYPFGLTMAGISSKALKSEYAQNKNKFNGGNEFQSNEFSDGSGLEMYDATFRLYDPQIGRFHQIDLLANLFEDFSPYVFALNNPILLNDPLGLAADTAVEGVPEMEPVVVTPRNNNPSNIPQVVPNTTDEPSPDPSVAADFVLPPGVEREYPKEFLSYIGMLSEKVREKIVVEDWFHYWVVDELRHITVKPYGFWKSFWTGVPGENIFGEETASRIIQANAGRAFWRIGSRVLGYGRAAAKPALRITTYTFHGMMRKTVRGISSRHVLNTIRHPLLVIAQDKGKFMYLSRQAVVVLGSEGEVVTMYGASEFNSKILYILKFL